MQKLALAALSFCFFAACSNDSSGGAHSMGEKNDDSGAPSVSEADACSVPDEDLDKSRDDLGLENSIMIKYAGGSAEARSSYGGDAEISIDNEDVAVRLAGAADAKYNLVVSGAASAGSLKISGDREIALYLNGVSFESPGAAINIQSARKTAAHLADGSENSLAGGDYDDAKGVFYSKGALSFSGKGNLTVRSASGKNGIHSKGSICIAGGNIDIATTAAKSHGISSGDAAIVSGSAFLKIDVSGNGSKGIKSDGSFAARGGEIYLSTSGDADIDDSASPIDTSAAAGIKASKDIEISGGAIFIESFGKGGRGISADGSIAISGSETVIDIATYGDVFGSASGQPGGGGQPGGWNQPGGGRGPMQGSSGKGAKAIKAKGKIEVNGGSIKVSTAGTEAEGMESKDTLVINGGTIEIKAYDDGINASKHIAINGGKVYSESSSNDGIDSNGSLEINGGIIVSAGSSSPEEGFDCDNNTFKISGGTMIGIGGATSNPTGGASSQNSLVYTAPAQASSLRIEDSSGRSIFSFVFPKTYGSARPVALFSSPDFINGSYKITTSAAISGGSEIWHGIYENAAYSGGTSASLEVSGRVTTVRN